MAADQGAPDRSRRRGRPVTITRERISAAGVEMTLPAITITGLAKHLGIAVTSLYKHVEGVEGLRDLVAGAILAAWTPPPPIEPTVADHLMSFSRSLRVLCAENPGIGEYLIQVNQSESSGVLAAMDRHQRSVIDHYGLPAGPGSLAISAIATHALAVSALTPDEVMSKRDVESFSREGGLETLAAGIQSAARIPGFDAFEWSMQALIDGALRLAVDDPEAREAAT